MSSNQTPEQIQAKITMQPIESSQIEAIGHDPETKTMAVTFKRYRGGGEGPTYHYAGVQDETFAEFLEADSPSRFLRDKIKAYPGAYPYIKLDQGE